MTRRYWCRPNNQWSISSYFGPKETRRVGDHFLGFFKVLAGEGLLRVSNMIITSDLLLEFQRWLELDVLTVADLPAIVADTLRYAIDMKLNLRDAGTPY